MQEVWQSFVVGLRPGSAYALIAVGVVIIFRGSGVLNFSQGAMAMVGAYAFYEAHLNGQRLPVVPALLISLLAGAIVGCIVYTVVVRWLVSQSDLVKVVATLGVLSTLQGLAVIIYGIKPRFVAPLFTRGSDPNFTIFGARMLVDTAVILGAIVLTCVLASLLFNRTRFGATATALREDAMASASLGISPHIVGMATWAFGGAIAAIAGALLMPSTGLSPTVMTLLVIPALAAGLLGRFNAIFLTAGIGLLMGIAQSELQLEWNVAPSYTQALPFVVVIISLMVGGRALPGRGWSELSRQPSVAPSQRRIVLPVVLAILAAATANALKGAYADAVITSVILAILGLSIVVVTGLAGQLSLAPFALAGVGSLTAAKLASEAGFPFLPAILIAGVVATAIGLIIGVPAVRVRGVNLAIATAGLALLVEQSLLASPWATNHGFGIQLDPPSLFGLDINAASHTDRYAMVCIVLLLVFGYGLVNIRGRASGRRYLAIRANERGAASLGVRVPEAKLAAFGVSAFLAGVAGGLTTFRYGTVTFTDFSLTNSFTLIAIVVIAGVGYLSGGVASGILSTGGVLSYFISTQLGWHGINQWLPVIFGLWVISAVVQSPSGFIGVYAKGLTALARRLHVDRLDLRTHIPWPDRPGRPDAVVEPPSVKQEGPLPTADRPVVLTARDVTVRYGAVTAVAHLDLDLRAGEVLGVIGPNGAGKTTLIDALTGFARVTGGSIRFADTEITHTPPHRRARLGMGRTFQNLELFEDLSVRENLLVASDGQARHVYASDAVRPRNVSLPAAAMNVLALLNLLPYLDEQVSGLPQGVRRMVAIARVACQGPKVICLDEPAAGLGAGERRTAAAAFRDLARHLGMAVLLVEHNVDIVADVCDQVVVIDFGAQIAGGPPAAVLADPAVRAAYLGSFAKDDKKEAEPGVQLAHH